jgi:hypothetical protein
MKNLLIGTLLFFLGQSLIWIQTNGQFVWKSFKDNPFLLAFGFGTIISYILIYATRFTVEYFDGMLWPGRFIAFGMGIVSFTFLTWFFLGEGITTKTAVSLGLSLILMSDASVCSSYSRKKTGEELASSLFLCYIKIVKIVMVSYLVSFALGISVVGIIAGIRLFRQLKETQQQIINLQKELNELCRDLTKIRTSVDGKLGLVNQEIDLRFNQIGKTLNQEMEQVEERVKFLSKRVSQEY